MKLPGLVDYVREQAVEVMSLNRVPFCVGRLETARRGKTRTFGCTHDVEAIA